MLCQRATREVGLKKGKFTTTNTQRIIELLGSFDSDWRLDLESYLVDEHKDAVNSVVDLRNTISHGRNIVVTMALT